MKQLIKSQPSSVSVQLPKLTAVLNIEESGPTRQWHSNMIEGNYYPNRSATSPLVLVPTVPVENSVTGAVTLANFVGVTKWQTRETIVEENPYGTYSGSTGEWIDVTNNTPSAQVPYSYDPSTFALYVKRNVPLNTIVELKFIAEYAHPEFPGYTYKDEAIIVLATNEDFEVLIPTLSLDVPNSTHYDVLLDESLLNDKEPVPSPTYVGNPHYRIKTMNVSAELGGSAVTSNYTYYWYITEDNVEYPVGASNNHPCYVSGGTGANDTTLTVDMMYAENIHIKCMCKPKYPVSGMTVNDFFPSMACTDITWKTLPITVETVCDNGAIMNGEVSSSYDKVFKPLVNIRGGNIQNIEQRVAKNFLFHWYKKFENTKMAASTITDLGWGPTLTIASDQLVPNNAVTNGMTSVNIYAEVYLKGPYRLVTDGNGNPIIEDGHYVYERN